MPEGCEIPYHTPPTPRTCPLPRTAQPPSPRTHRALSLPPSPNTWREMYRIFGRFRESVTQTYEVTLQRPPGLILEQVRDSSGKAESVVVAGIQPGSPAEASGAVECGDTVVAVSSSLGNVMWPYRYYHLFSEVTVRTTR